MVSYKIEFKPKFKNMFMIKKKPIKYLTIWCDLCHHWIFSRIWLEYSEYTHWERFNFYVELNGKNNKKIKDSIRGLTQTVSNKKLYKVLKNYRYFCGDHCYEEYKGHNDNI